MTWYEILLFIVSVVVMLVGLAGTVLPVLPGVPIIFAAALLYSVATGFAAPDSTTLGIFAILTGLTFLLDWLATVVGVKRMGGTWAGVVGSFVGMVVTLMIPGLGVLAFLAGAFAGAVLGELLFSTDTRRAIRAGTGSFLGLVLGGLAKFVIGSVMIGWFIAEVLL
jgi:uncharacterized protein YqgC (DUF456 family)